MSSCRRFYSTDVDVTMPKLTQEQRHYAIGCLQAGVKSVDVAQHKVVCRASINKLWEALVTDQGQTDREQPIPLNIDTSG